MTSEFGKAPSSYAELARARTPRTYRARRVAAIILAVSAPLICAWSAKGPDHCMNAATNIEYAKQARDGGTLSLPALFLRAAYDFVCETTANSRFADPMRNACSNLTEVYIKSGLYMAQEQSVAVNRALARFIAKSYRNCSASFSGHNP
jgi:pimeloyl-ACP methyl ester carboxylesterase